MTRIKVRRLSVYQKKRISKSLATTSLSEKNISEEFSKMQSSSSSEMTRLSEKNNRRE